MRTLSIARLGQLGISQRHAQVLIDIAKNLDRCNLEAWGDAEFWWADDDSQSFWLADNEAGENAWPRHVSDWEQRELRGVSDILHRNPQIAAIMRPDPSRPALQVVPAPVIQTNGLVIPPKAPPAPSPEDLEWARQHRIRR